MRKLTKILIAISFLLTVTCLLSYAAVPHLINYQGRLTDSGGTALSGSYDLTFRIYDAEAAGNLLWEETQSGVLIQKGIFSVLLGAVTNLNLAFDKPYFLEIKVGAEVMSPRQRITSAGYALNAENAEKIKADSADPTSGYLSDKVDNTTVKVDAATHKIYAIPPSRSQLFTSSGTFTVPAGITQVYVTAVGGGGGGAGGYWISQYWHAAGGGGSGSMYIRKPVTVVAGNSYAVVVGAGGAAGATSGAGGGTGEDSTFGSTLVVAMGGRGAPGGYINSGGAGGGKPSVPTGGYGIPGTDGAAGIDQTGGGGAGSAFGEGGAGGGPGGNGTGYGSGGGGGGVSNSGGAGAPGFVLIEW